MDDVGAAHGVLVLAAAGDAHLGEVAHAREHLLRRARLNAGAENREHARVGPRQKLRRERRRRSGAHRGDVRPVHERRRRPGGGIDERDESLVRRPVAVPLEERHELAAHPGSRRVPRHRAEHAGAGPHADARHELRGVGGKLRVRGGERVDELVEIEQLLDVGASQDEHFEPDGTPRARASVAPSNV